MLSSGEQCNARFGRLIGRISRHWRAEIDRRLQSSEVTEAMLVPLMQLSLSDRPMRQKDLAEALAMDCSSLVRVLGNLHAAGLIDRQRDENDRRAHMLSVTRKGHDVVTRIAAVSFELEDSLLAGIDPEDINTMKRVLILISERLMESRLAARTATPQSSPQSMPRGPGRTPPASAMANLRDLA